MDNYKTRYYLCINVRLFRVTVTKTSRFRENIIKTANESLGELKFRSKDTEDESLCPMKNSLWNKLALISD